MKPILDVCCGGRMWWFDKNDERAVFMDKRTYEGTLCDGRHFEVNPDILGDFTNIPFPDESFHLVVFDPPHLEKLGETSWLCIKYGKLPSDWKDKLTKAFEECFRVLKPFGTLVFKWNEEQIKLSEILKLTTAKPVVLPKRFENRYIVEIDGGNGWACFMCARPIGRRIEPQIDGDIYAWEEK